MLERAIGRNAQRSALSALPVLRSHPRRRSRTGSRAFISDRARSTRSSPRRAAQHTTHARARPHPAARAAVACSPRATNVRNRVKAATSRWQARERKRARRREQVSRDIATFPGDARAAWRTRRRARALDRDRRANRLSGRARRQLRSVRARSLDHQIRPSACGLEVRVLAANEHEMLGAVMTGADAHSLSGARRAARCSPRFGRSRRGLLVVDVDLRQRARLLATRASPRRHLPRLRARGARRAESRNGERAVQRRGDVSPRTWRARMLVPHHSQEHRWRSQAARAGGEDARATSLELSRGGWPIAQSACLRSASPCATHDLTTPLTVPGRSMQQLGAARVGRGRRIVLYAATRGTTEGMREPSRTAPRHRARPARVRYLDALPHFHALHATLRTRRAARARAARSFRSARSVPKRRSRGPMRRRARRSGGSSRRRSRHRLSHSPRRSSVTDPAGASHSGPYRSEWCSRSSGCTRPRICAPSGSSDATPSSRSRTLRVHLVAAVGMAYVCSGFRGAILGVRHRRAREPLDGARCAPFRPAYSRRRRRACSASECRSRSPSRSTIPAQHRGPPLVVAAYGGRPQCSGSTRSASRLRGSPLRSRGSYARGSSRMSTGARELPVPRQRCASIPTRHSYCFSRISFHRSLVVLALRWSRSWHSRCHAILPAAAAARIHFTAAAGGIALDAWRHRRSRDGQQRALPLLSALALAINLACSLIALELGVGLALVAGGAVLAQRRSRPGGRHPRHPGDERSRRCSYSRRCCLSRGVLRVALISRFTILAPSRAVRNCSRPSCSCSSRSHR